MRNIYSTAQSDIAFPFRHIGRRKPGLEFHRTPFPSHPLGPFPTEVSGASPLIVAKIALVTLICGFGPSMSLPSMTRPSSVSSTISRQGLSSTAAHGGDERASQGGTSINHNGRLLTRRDGSQVPVRHADGTTCCCCTHYMVYFVFGSIPLLYVSV